MPVTDAIDVLDLSSYVAEWARQAPMGADLPILPDERIRAYDAAVAAGLQAGEQQLLSGLSQRGLTLRGRMELDLAHDLHRVVRFFVKFFRVADGFPAQAFDPGVHFCETLDEFVAALLQTSHLSDYLKTGEGEKLKAQIETAAPRGGLYGFCAAHGAYLNGWLLNYGRESTPRQLLKTPDRFPIILRFAIHEAIGHGFFNQFSAVGQELEQVGGQAWDYAQRFQLRLHDSPQSLLRLRRWRIVNGTALILNEGWTSWLESLLTPALFGQARQPRYTLAQLWTSLESLPHPGDYRAALRGALASIFLSPPADPQGLFLPLRLLESLMADPRLPMPQPLEYALGALLFDRLEAAIGLANVPGAMLTAANIRYDLETISTSELVQLVQGVPRFNANWRLAALSGLKWPGPVSWPALAAAASDQLNLAVPEALVK